MVDPGWIVAAVALAGAILTAIGWGSRWAWRLGRKLWIFSDDWNGEPKSPGHPGAPGVMERLARLEDTNQKILGELTVDSGRSVKDVVNNIQSEVSDLRKDTNGLRVIVDDLQRRRP